MKIFNVLAFLAWSFLCSYPAMSAHDYGEKITGSESVSVSKAIEILKGSQTNQIDTLIKAKVTSVCQAKGCWLALTNADDRDRNIRVTFKDYGFFVPPTLVGDVVLVEGTLKEVELSLEDSKHYIKDAGGNPDEVTQPITEYQMIAAGVKVIH